MSVASLLGIELPIVQAPMAGVHGHALAVAASGAGALGSLPCAMLSVEEMRTELAARMRRRRRTRSASRRGARRSPPTSPNSASTRPASRQAPDARRSRPRPPTCSTRTAPRS